MLKVMKVREVKQYDTAKGHLGSQEIRGQSERFKAAAKVEGPGPGMSSSQASSPGLTTHWQRYPGKLCTEELLIKLQTTVSDS